MRSRAWFLLFFLACVFLTGCGAVVDYPGDMVEGTMVFEPYGGGGTLELRNTSNCLIREAEVTTHDGWDNTVTQRFVGDIPARQQRTYRHTLSDAGGFQFRWSVTELKVRRPFPFAPC